MASKQTEIESTSSTDDKAVESSPKSRGFGSFLLSCLIANLVMFVAIAGIAYSKREVLLEKFQPILATQSSEKITLLAEVVNCKSRIALLEQRLAAQEASLNALQASIANTNTGQALIDNQKLSALEASLNELKQQAGSATEMQTLRDQIQQITVLQQGLSQQVQQQAAQTLPDLRLVAFFQTLRSKALDGQPFQDAFQRFFAIAQNHPVIAETAEPLEVYSALGRPSLIDLQHSFNDSLQTYLKEKDGVDNSLSGKVKRNLADFITVRKLEDSDDSPLAAINRAEESLRSDHVEKAVTELNDLPQDIEPYFTAWVEEAKGYYRIPQLIQKLDQRVADAVMQTSTDAPHAP